MKGIDFLTYTRIQWTVILVIFIVEFVWIKFSSLTFYYNTKDLVTIFLFLMIFYIPYLVYKKFRPDPKILTVFLSVLFLHIFGYLMLVFSYLVATTNQPFVDSTLGALDSYMGFSSPDIVMMFRSHAWLYKSFILIYNSFLFQPYLIIFYFGFFGKSVYLERFFMQFIIASLLTELMAGIFPAAGPYVWYNYPASPDLNAALDHLYELRNNVLDITKKDGIVSLPSFHTILALLYLYTFRHQRKIIFIPILILNLLIIFSCLPIGQHYLTDIIAGVALFALTVAIEQLVYCSVKKNKEPLWVPFQDQVKQNSEIP